MQYAQGMERYAWHYLYEITISMSMERHRHAIEALRRKLWRIFDPQGIIMLPIRSLPDSRGAGDHISS